MQILSAEQIRLWDEFTIINEPIVSIDLMERAANACVDWLESERKLDNVFSIFCGKGNNGGDGLAIARLLTERSCQVTVHILEFGHKGTEDFQINLARLHQTSAQIRFIQNEETIPEILPHELLIDALFGSGLNRPLDGVTASLIRLINDSANEVISIDVPSGLFVDKSSKGNPVVGADYTLSFQCYKPAFLLAENGPSVGKLQVLDIGLHPGFIDDLSSENTLVDLDFARTLYKPRNPFAHKGNFGHALLIAGSYGKMGAALMAARACLRSGCGLLTCHLPGEGVSILQSAIPEAMLDVDQDEKINTKLSSDLSKFNSIGIGPGLGTEDKTKSMLLYLLKKTNAPLVVDADGLNLLALDKNNITLLPPYSVLTPHPKEFERLFGSAENDFARIELAREQAKITQSVIVLKGHFSFIAVPGGMGFYNSTGNPGMAKGGSGDALTGIITGLLAQGYSSIESAILGVFVHGLAGDIAAGHFGETAMLPTDLIDSLGEAFRMVAAKP
jgi:ADP-dependent NAD(P)H-hydrate dehydratase / NAD(P)H-hydrate epimerase